MHCCFNYLEQLLITRVCEQCTKMTILFESKHILTFLVPSCVYKFETFKPNCCCSINLEYVMELWLCAVWKSSLSSFFLKKKEKIVTSLFLRWAHFALSVYLFAHPFHRFDNLPAHTSKWRCPDLAGCSWVPCSAPPAYCVPWVHLHQPSDYPGLITPAISATVILSTLPGKHLLLIGSIK